MSADDLIRTVEPAVGPQPETIQLVNPVSDHYETFIFSNALKCERVVEQDTHVGETVVICGAGPTLRDHAAKWCPRGSQVWGCNSAATYLYSQGLPVTHAFTVDQTPAMLEEWYSVPDVEYLLASSCHPHLVEFLLARDRRVTFFNNYVGIRKPPVEYCACGHDHPSDIVQMKGDVTAAAPTGTPRAACAQDDCDCATYTPRRMLYEDWLYQTLFPNTVRAGSSLNSVTRAMDVAWFMGFERVVLLGADCALRVTKPKPANARPGNAAEMAWLADGVEMHADGGHALSSGATATTFTGVIDGRKWLTKPDMAITAVWLERWRRQLDAERADGEHKLKLTIVGDTLPNALRGKPDAFLDRMPSLVDGAGAVRPEQ